MIEKLHAIVSPDGTVDQVVVWDGVTPWPPSKALDVKPCDAATGIGWKRSKGAFTAPVPIKGTDLPAIANGDAKLAFGG